MIRAQNIKISAFQRKGLYCFVFLKCNKFGFNWFLQDY